MPESAFLPEPFTVQASPEALADVREVDPETAEADSEARKPGEHRLLGRPVEPVRPVGDELAEVAEVGSE